MKLKLTTLSILALLGFRAPRHFTANAAKDDIADLQTQFDELRAQNAAQATRIAELEAAASIKPPAPPEEDTSTLALLCRGAGIDIADVRWRVRAGLDPEQAVAVAIEQKAFNAEKAALAEKAAADKAAAASATK